MANSEAIASYVEEAQRLLEEQQRRAESLQTRAGQIAGFGAVLLALLGGNAATILHEVHDGRTEVAVLLIAATLFLAVSVAVAVIGVSSLQSYASIAAEEVGNYLTDPFLDAPELWRVQVRSLRALRRAIEDAQERGNAVLKSITISLYSLLVGLALAVVAIAVLTVELI
jgi:ABC-type glycerol-3-phosphate transport system permease component